MEKIVQRVIGPFDRYCSASGMQPTDAYVTAPLIGTGVAPLATTAGSSSNGSSRHGSADLLARIVAFDRAEASFANITQTNLVQVSSFNGIDGLLLGYDLLPQPFEPHPLLASTRGDRSGDFPVFDAEPLFAATRALFGTVCDKRFPIAPGQHLLCAYKTMHHAGPCLLYGALAAAIAEDRKENADLFMEDHAVLSSDVCGDEEALRQPLMESLYRLIDSVRQISENLGVHYARLFVGHRTIAVQEGEIGCVLTAAPYINLARNAVQHSTPEHLAHISLREWQGIVEPHFLSNQAI